MIYPSDSPSTAPTSAAAAPGNLLEMHIFRPTLHLPNQKLWGWSPMTCVLVKSPHVILMLAQVGEPLIHFNCFLLSPPLPGLMFLLPLPPDFPSS